MSASHSATDTTVSYIDAVAISDLFVDHDYQRDLDLPRARKLAEDWDRRLVGVLEVSDRGTDHHPRYAIIDGQHRYAAAKLRDANTILVANVHSGLSTRDEARLFYEIDAKRRRLTGWDRWNARRGAGDPVVLAIESIVEDAGLRVDPAPRNGNIRCVSACEKIIKLGGEKLLREAIDLIKEVWGVQIEAFDAPLLHGTAYVLYYFGSDVDVERLGDAMVDVSPRQFKATAVALRGAQSGTMPKLAALVILNAYNRTKGPKLKAPKDFTKAPRNRRHPLREAC
ncbi:DUF6551 family protein [Mycolicibacterium mageritense]|uniref:DUF6551 family protein n=1 Tax=Mycolicibacterium mageritense TaxID=53462 RepID=UPI0011DC3D3B|nr:DUF6551 family protein [Mycolicibacterium mageritense]TXI59036.1 MAG: hypothetical protein E6Q55_22365 [Mycolicibacterium mageritense]